MQDAEGVSGEHTQQSNGSEAPQIAQIDRTNDRLKRDSL
jgi:hypothetical protein